MRHKAVFVMLVDGKDELENKIQTASLMAGVQSIIDEDKLPIKEWQLRSFEEVK